MIVTYSAVFFVVLDLSFGLYKYFLDHPRSLYQGYEEGECSSHGYGVYYSLASPSKYSFIVCWAQKERNGNRIGMAESYGQHTKYNHFTIISVPTPNKRVTVYYEYDNPSQLFHVFTPYDLDKGQVFYVSTDGEMHQLKVAIHNNLTNYSQVKEMVAGLVNELHEFEN